MAIRFNTLIKISTSGLLALSATVGLIGCNKGQHKNSDKMTDEKYLKQRCVHSATAQKPILDINQYIAIRNAKLAEYTDAKIVTYIEDMSTTNASRKISDPISSEMLDKGTIEYNSAPIRNGMGQVVSLKDSTTAEGSAIFLDKIDCNSMSSDYRGPGVREATKVKVTAVKSTSIKFEELPMAGQSDVLRKFEISVEAPNPKSEKRETLNLRFREEHGLQTITIKITNIIGAGKDKETQTFVVKQVPSYKVIKDVEVKPSVATSLKGLAQLWDKQANLQSSSDPKISNVEIVKKEEGKDTEKTVFGKTILALSESLNKVNKAGKVTVPLAVFDSLRNPEMANILNIKSGAVVVKRPAAMPSAPSGVPESALSAASGASASAAETSAAAPAGAPGSTAESGSAPAAVPASEPDAVTGATPAAEAPATATSAARPAGSSNQADASEAQESEKQRQKTWTELRREYNRAKVALPPNPPEGVEASDLADWINKNVK